MCLQCVTNPWYYGTPFPGWMLMRARRADSLGEMAVRDWGLVQCNDPSIIFKTTPFLYEDEDQLWDSVDSFDQEIACHPVIGYELIHAFKQVPPIYRIKRLYVKYRILGCGMSTQLYLYLADFIANSHPFVEEDPFPNNNAHSEHDYHFDPKEP